MGAFWRSLAAATLIACSSASGESTRPDGTPPAAASAPCAAPLRAEVQRGVCYAHNYQHLGYRGYGSDASAASRAELKKAGVTWLSITPFGFSRTLESTRVRHIGSFPGGESDERVQNELRAAHRDGFRVLLKPHVWIGGGQWRGAIAPEGANGWAAWFQSYGEWLLHYARMAEREKVALLSVGVEFGSSSRAHADRWRALIRQVRQVYSGELTYSANWDEVARVPFWADLDYVGVQFYSPLGDGDEASKRAKLNTALDGLGVVAKSAGRPVLFTEVGYRSIASPELEPHAWPERASGKRVDQAAQAQAYARFLSAVARRPWVRGIYWWKWFTDPDSKEEGTDGFSPRGKAALTTLQSAYKGKCANPALGHTASPPGPRESP